MARRGTSLVELLVALLLLQLVGTAALATAFLATRLAARAHRGIATDRLRRETLHAIAAAPACRTATPATTLSVTFPASPEREALTVRLPCGGTSLVELLVTLTLLGLVGSLAVTILQGTTRPLARLVATAAAGRTVAALEQLTAREAATPAGLRAAVVDASTLDLDRYVGDAPTCTTSATAIALALDDWQGDRHADASRDIVAIRDRHGSWHEAAVTAVGPGACPDGRPGRWLTLDRPVVPGWAVVHEPTRVRAYAGTGGRWLGMLAVRSLAPIQPFAGPLAADGLAVVTHPAGVSATITPHAAPATTLHFAVGHP